ncbi:MAG: hypothetical protein GY695_24025, partial [Aestuariibacter sp.]|nr:hypothetical protein [Aestuariibacter sp.]
YLRITPGVPHNTNDESLLCARVQANEYNHRFNTTSPSAFAERSAILSALLAKSKGVQVASTIYVEYGCHTHIGKGTFLNHNVSIIDACPVHIGNQVLIGPNTVISSVVGRFTAGPDTDHEVANPVTLGHRVWVGANVRIAAGVSIGDNCVIGAGSLVTESLPANTLAYGIPAARIRKIQQNPQ